MRPLFIPLLCLLLPAAALAQPAQLQLLEQQLVQARGTQSWPQYLHLAKQLHSLLPQDPDNSYRVAKGYYLTHQVDSSLSYLQLLASKGLVYNPGDDSAFKPLTQLPAYLPVAAQFAHNAQPVTRGKVLINVPLAGQIVESVVWDAARQRYLLGCVTLRKVLVTDAHGEWVDFSAPGDSLGAVLGMAVDEDHDKLWVCSAGLPELAGFKEAEAANGLFCYRLSTGKLLNKYLLPTSLPAPVLGDVRVDGQGIPYATDSRNTVYRLLDKHLEVWLQSKDFISLQGLAWDETGQYLYLADYVQGIFRINANAKTYQLLPTPPQLCVTGTDGLYAVKGGLILTQNGVQPNRVLYVGLNNGGTAIRNAQVLEAGPPSLQDPTLGTVVGRNFIYIAASNWAALGQGGKVVNGLSYIPIRSTPIPGARE